MSGPLYCDREDVYRQAPRGSLTEPARLVAAVDTATNVFTVNGHALRANDAIAFRLGSDDGAMPTGLVAGATYYASPITDSTFRVLDAPNGSVVVVTTTGSNVLLVVDDTETDREIANASRVFDGACIGHVVPFEEPIPDEVRTWVAKVACFHRLEALGRSSPALSARLGAAMDQLKMLARGVFLRDPEATSQTKMARGKSPDATTTGSEIVP